MKLRETRTGSPTTSSWRGKAERSLEQRRGALPSELIALGVQPAQRAGGHPQCRRKLLRRIVTEPVAANPELGELGQLRGTEEGDEARDAAETQLGALEPPQIAQRKRPHVRRRVGEAASPIGRRSRD